MKRFIRDNILKAAQVEFPETREVYWAPQCDPRKGTFTIEEMAGRRDWKPEDNVYIFCDRGGGFRATLTFEAKDLWVEAAPEPPKLQWHNLAEAKTWPAGTLYMAAEVRPDNSIGRCHLGVSGTDARWGRVLSDFVDVGCTHFAVLPSTIA